MNRLRGVVRSVIVTSITIGLSVSAAPARAQTPGQVPMFAQPGTGACNAAQANDCSDSVITQDASGNIGIGTTTPAAALDVATGNLNLAGNLFKGGMLFLHNSGTNNTFVGQFAGNQTMTGTNNAAIGTGALGNNTTGFDNTASGSDALASNTTGADNTAIGFALVLNTTGFNNTATGFNALVRNNTGFSNTANGVQALFTNAAGNANTALGAFADVSAVDLTNATAVGFAAIVDASNKIRLGNSSVSVIEGQVPFTFTSDKNQKENFHAVDGTDVLRRLAGLNVMSWNYIGHDPRQFRHYGPVAQEFFAAFGHDAVGTIGTPTTINSGDLEGILLIAVQALQKENADLTARVDALERQLTGKAAAGR